MEWFWATVVFLSLAAMGLLVFFVIYYWFKEAAEAAAQEQAWSRTAQARAAETGDDVHRRALT